MGKRTLIFAGAILAIFVGITGSAAYAATTNTFTLTDAIYGWTYQEGNLTGERTTATGGLPSSFSINGLNQLTQSWWWYRSGTGTYADTREYALSNETAFTQIAPNQVQLTYLEPAENGTLAGALQFQLNYVLTATSSTAASVNVTWSVANLSGSPLPVNMFGYVNPDLMNTPNNDTALLTDFSNTAGEVHVTDGGTGTTMDIEAGTTARSPTLYAWEVANYDTTLAKLSNNTVDDLSDTSTEVGPGDVTAAFQWQNTIQSSGGCGGSLEQSVIIVGAPTPSVPEVGSLLLAMPALTALAVFRLRKA